MSTQVFLDSDPEIDKIINTTCIKQMIQEQAYGLCVFSQLHYETNLLNDVRVFIVTDHSQQEFLQQIENFYILAQLPFFLIDMIQGKFPGELHSLYKYIN